jgi:hypothetical protein
MGKDGSFENVKDQIGFCGLWCGSCVAGNGTLQVLTSKYLALTEAYDLKQWAPKDFDYTEFDKGLRSIQSMPGCPGCLQGGGNPECVMRTCAQEKKLADCSRCREPECAHEEALKKMRNAAHEAGLMVKDQEIDSRELIEQWTGELKAQWPSSLLFEEDN